jgi:acetyltransferase
MRPDDIDRELAFLQTLTPETLYLRLQYVASEPTRHEVERLLDLDYIARFALGAFIAGSTGEELVGVSRYARIEDSNRAECAIVVGDAWQGRGLGTELIRTLADAARRAGITHLEGTALPENQRILHWARRFGFPVASEPHSGGLMRVVLDLTDLPAPAG